MLSRRSALALSGALLAALCGCADGGHEPVDPAPAEPEPEPAEEAASARFPASFLRLCALSQEDVLEQYANGASEDALDAVAEGDDVILTFTAGQLEAQVRKREETLAEETASLLERDCADAVDVSDDLRAITVTARPCFTDDNDAAADLYTIMVACGYLQLFDGQEDWGFRAAFVDADTGIEVAAADMPGEGLTISRDIWADALSAAGVPYHEHAPAHGM